jgi:hypothetical protein
MTAEFSLHNFENKKKYFHENPSIARRVVSCGYTCRRMDREIFTCYSTFRNLFQMLVTHKFPREIFKNSRIFLDNMHIAGGETERERKREGITKVQIRNLVTPFQMHCTSTETLRIFWPSSRQWRQIHITVCQVNTATHLVSWLTQMVWFRK